MSQEASEEPAASSRAWIVGALSVIALPAVFYGLFWNRYFGINLDGWFQLYGQEILKGKVPYRDFYLFTNPWHAFESAGITALFGTQWWLLRLIAICQRLILALLTFYWLNELATIRHQQRLALWWRRSCLVVTSPIPSFITITTPSFIACWQASLLPQELRALPQNRVLVGSSWRG
jgi:hypothetical protein